MNTDFQSRKRLIWARGIEGHFPYACLWRRPFGFYWATQRHGFTLRVALGKRYGNRVRRVEFYRATAMNQTETWIRSVMDGTD